MSESYLASRYLLVSSELIESASVIHSQPLVKSVQLVVFCVFDLPGLGETHIARMKISA